MKRIIKSARSVIARLPNYQRIFRQALPVMLVAILIGPVVWGQEGEANPQSPMSQQAWAVLEEMVLESKEYTDLSLRIRVLAELADVMWPIDPGRAKDIIALAFDKVAELKNDFSSKLALRSKIVNIARKHDASFAEELLARLEEKTGESPQRISRDSIEQISERGALYVESSLQLLGEGDKEQAIDLARRSVSEGRSARFLWFLYALSQRDKEAADQLFLDALRIIRQQATTPNDILYLGLYLFSPGRMSVGEISGQIIIGHGTDFSAAPPPPDHLLHPYLQAAVEVLSRFSAIPGQPNYSGLMALKRSALQQLLPFFERYDPERAATMRAELDQFGPANPPNFWANRPPTPVMGKDQDIVLFDELTLNEVITKIKELPDNQQRDHYFFEVAVRALKRGDFERAQTLAERIHDINLKQLTLEWIGFEEAQKAIARGSLDDLVKASKIASAQLRQERRAIILHSIAKAWLKRGDFGRATDEINIAAAEATKIDDRAQQARVYIYLSAALAERDVVRAFEFIELAVKSINATKGFDPADGQILLEMSTPLGARHRFVISHGVSLISVVPHLARADFLRTIALARSLKADEARAFVMISACRTVLKDKL